MSDGWQSGTVECPVCLHRWVAVAPERVDEDELECPKCGRHGGRSKEELGY